MDQHYQRLVHIACVLDYIKDYHSYNDNQFIYQIHEILREAEERILCLAYDLNREQNRHEPDKYDAFLALMTSAEDLRYPLRKEGKLSVSEEDHLIHQYRSEMRGDFNVWSKETEKQASEPLGRPARARGQASSSDHDKIVANFLFKTKRPMEDIKEEEEEEDIKVPITALDKRIQEIEDDHS